MNFGQKIKSARINRNITQQQLADKFFVTRQTISNWENDNSYPDIMTLIRLGDYFDFSMDELLREDQEMRIFLDKKMVEHDFKPIYRNVMVIVCILFGLEVIDLFGIIHLGLMGWLLWLILMLSLNILNKLNGFDDSNSMGFRYSWQKIIKEKLNL